jgi:hypothetical protein
MKKLIILVLIPLCFAGFAQAQFSNTVTFKLKIINHLPVGWGDLYNAVIVDVVDGSKIQFGDTIKFGNINFSSDDYFTTGDVRTITFFNSREKNPNPYQPPCSCTVSKLNQIWTIKEIKK